MSVHSEVCHPVIFATRPQDNTFPPLITPFSHPQTSVHCRSIHSSRKNNSCKQGLSSFLFAPNRKTLKITPTATEKKYKQAVASLTILHLPCWQTTADFPPPQCSCAGQDPISMWITSRTH